MKDTFSPYKIFSLFWALLDFNNRPPLRYTTTFALRMTTTNDTKDDDEDEEDNEEEEEEEEEEEDARQSIPELQRLLLEYSAQMSELDATFGPEDGPEKAEMKKELEDLVELTREVLEERQKEEEEEEEEEEDHHHHHKNDDDDDTIENELEDLENLRQIEEEENAKRKREEEEKRWKVLKRPGGDDDDDTNTRTTTRTDDGCTHNKSNTTDIRNPGDEGEGKHHRGRRDAPTPQNLLYRGADDKPKYDDEGNLIVPKKFQIQEDDDKVTRDRKRKQLQTFKYKQKQKAVVSEHAKRASDWNDFKTKKASKKKRLDNMSSGVFKKKSMFSGVGDGEKNVSKLTEPKKHQFHSM